MEIRGHWLTWRSQPKHSTHCQWSMLGSVKVDMGWNAHEWQGWGSSRGTTGGPYSDVLVGIFSSGLDGEPWRNLTWSELPDSHVSVAGVFLLGQALAWHGETPSVFCVMIVGHKRLRHNLALSGPQRFWGNLHDLVIAGLASICCRHVLYEKEVFGTPVSCCHCLLWLKKMPLKWEWCTELTI